MKPRHLDRLERLKQYPAREVLTTPSLLLDMLSLYSELFLGSKPCSTCEKKHRAYLKRLINEGEAQIENIKIMSKVTYILKGIVFYKGVHYGNPPAKNVMTDAMAREFLKANPQNQRHFEKLPTAPKKATAKKKSEPAKK